MLGDLLRAYRVLIKTAWAVAFTYRAQIVLWILGFVFPLVMLAMWLTVEEQTGPIGGFDRGDFISYYVAAAAMYRLTAINLAYRWDHEIRSGDLSMQLLKPLDPFHYYFSEMLGWKLLDLMIIVPLVGGAILLVPTVDYPVTPPRLLAFVCAVVIGLVVNSLIGSSFGMIGFWTTQSRNLAGLWNGIGQFLSGFVVPLALFPWGVQQIAAWLPFRNAVSLPVEILMGRVNWSEICWGLGVGVGWALGAAIVYRMLWRRGLQRYEAVGA